MGSGNLDLSERTECLRQRHVRPHLLPYRSSLLYGRAEGVLRASGFEMLCVDHLLVEPDMLQWKVLRCRPDLLQWKLLRSRSGVLQWQMLRDRSDLLQRQVLSGGIHLL